jgi:hypothetical protein
MQFILQFVIFGASGFLQNLKKRTSGKKLG